jgi:hypothetical protein
MIVDDLDFVCVAITPHEADAESLVDSDAVLSSPVTFELFESVARKNCQVLESMGCMQLLQLPLRDPRHRSEFPRDVTG